MSDMSIHGFPPPLPPEGIHRTETGGDRDGTSPGYEPLPAEEDNEEDKEEQDDAAVPPEAKTADTDDPERQTDLGDGTGQNVDITV